jgi:hypothetical protein
MLDNPGYIDGLNVGLRRTIKPRQFRCRQPNLTAVNLQRGQGAEQMLNHFDHG